MVQMLSTEESGSYTLEERSDSSGEQYDGIY
jgi:hypothetical protein